MIKRYYQNFNINYKGNFIIEYGVVNKLTPEVIYITGKTYLNAKTKDDDYNTIIKSIFKLFKQKLTKYVRESEFTDKFIFDFDILKNLEPTFKNKILTFEIYLKQEKDKIELPNRISKRISELISPLLQILETELNSYTIKLSKAKCK